MSVTEPKEFFAIDEAAAWLSARTSGGHTGDDVLRLPDFLLESTDGLEGTNTTWTPVTNVPTVVGDDNTVTFTNSVGDSFFRLRRFH